MARTTSFQLSDELDKFIAKQVESGAFSSASEVVRTALERFADDERKEAALLAAIDRGLESKRAKAGVFERLRAKHGVK